MDLSINKISSIYRLGIVALPVAGTPGFLIESMPTNLDPRIGIDAQSERMDGLIFSSLIELDSERNPQGDLADKWEIPDPLTYVFHLHSGIRFHNGQALTAAVVLNAARGHVPGAGEP